VNKELGYRQVVVVVVVVVVEMREHPFKDCPH